MATVQTGIITTVGLGILSDLTANLSPTKWPLYIAWGGGSTTPAANLTSLVSEQQRVLAAVTDTTLRVNLKATFSISLPWQYQVEDLPFVAKEAGVFDAATGGNMLYYVRYGAAYNQPLYHGDTYYVIVYLLLEQG